MIKPHILVSVLILILFACGQAPDGGPPIDGVIWNVRNFTLSPLGTPVTMSAAQCGRPSASTLIVALHDLGYDRRQFTETAQGLGASMAQALCSSGVAVLAPDLLGAGSSARVDGDQLTLDVQALAMQQMLGQLPRWERIVLLGQGGGGAVAVRASTGIARTALALLGFSIHSYVFPVLPVSFQPILQQGPYVDWRQPAPGPDSIRSFLGYYQPGAAPGAAAWDDKVLGQAAPRGSWWQMLQLQGQPTVLRPGLVTHPVLEVLGDRDPWFPASQGQQDQALFPLAPRFEVATAAQTGHALPQHLSAPQTTQLLLAWVQSL